MPNTVPPDVERRDLAYFDLVRALAAQAVVIGHALNLSFPEFFMRSTGNGMIEGRGGLFLVQNLGVDAFFVISGFLVTASAMRVHERHAEGFSLFIAARFRRIYGPFLSLLVILLVVESLAYPPDANLLAVVVHADLRTFALNAMLLFDHPILSLLARFTGAGWLKAGAFGTAAQLWTIVIEWWIYVLFGALWFSWIERRLTLFRAASALAAVAVPMYWLHKGNALPLAWIVGMLFALNDRRVSALSRRVALMTSIISLSLAFARAIFDEWSFYDPLFLVPASIGVIAGFYATKRKSQHSTLVRYFSDRSYSLYLVHLSIVFAIFHFLPGTKGFVSLAAGIILSNVAADVFHRLFEVRWIRKPEKGGPRAVAHG